MTIHLTDPEGNAVIEVEAVDNLLPHAQEIAVIADKGSDIMADPVLMLAAKLSSIGLDKEMFALVMREQANERAAQAEERFNDAMSLCQAEIVPVARTAQNKATNSFYAKLEAVDAAIRPIYLRHGFNVAYNTVPPLTVGNIRVECEVSLGRHSKKYYREAAPDTAGPGGKANKTMLHGGGSTETYVKRYAVCGAFNVVFRNLDDDGVRGGKEFVTDEQLAILQKLVEETQTKLPEFFAVMVSEEIHELNEVSQLDFARLANALARKKNQMQRKGDAA
jgi:hypothetical protein